MGGCAPWARSGWENVIKLKLNFNNRSEAGRGDVSSLLKVQLCQLQVFLSVPPPPRYVEKLHSASHCPWQILSVCSTNTIRSKTWKKNVNGVVGGNYRSCRDETKRDKTEKQNKRRAERQFKSMFELRTDSNNLLVIIKITFILYNTI